MTTSSSSGSAVAPTSSNSTDTWQPDHFRPPCTMLDVSVELLDKLCELECPFPPRHALAAIVELCGLASMRPRHPDDLPLPQRFTP